jgi:segregation and condensation protein B
MSQRRQSQEPLDLELDGLPHDLRWREWMGRVEAVLFASPKPVTRETLARVVGQSCSVDLIIEDIRAELQGRPYEIASVAGGWQFRTKKGFADAIRTAVGDGLGAGVKRLTNSEALALVCIAYFQPITRGELSQFFGKEISRDTIAHLRELRFIGPGPRSPQPGSPYSYVTTKEFLAHFGMESLRDLPDMEKLEDSGLLSREKLLAGEIVPHLFEDGEEEAAIEDEE